MKLIQGFKPLGFFFSFSALIKFLGTNVRKWFVTVFVWRDEEVVVDVKNGALEDGATLGVGRQHVDVNRRLVEPEESLLLLIIPCSHVKTVVHAT